MVMEAVAAAAAEAETTSKNQKKEPENAKTNNHKQQQQQKQVSKSRLTKLNLHDETIPILSDDPCWGDENLCSLPHLIRLLSQTNGADGRCSSSSIEQVTKNYIVLNKPPDLRMDGPYQSTVHKLLLYYYPPPSLLSSITQDTTINSNDSSSMDRTNDAVLNRIKTLHIFPAGIPKSQQHRPCHQLDYATSGVLLVARTKQFAGHAQNAFQHRLTTKTYSAVLHGHLHIRTILLSQQQQQTNNDGTADETASSDTDTTMTLPTLSIHTVHEQMNALEDMYRDTKQKICKQKEFEGYLPDYSIFYKWQVTTIQKLKRQSSTTATTSNTADDTSSNTMNREQQNNRTNATKKQKKNHLANGGFTVSSNDLVDWDTFYDTIQVPPEELNDRILNIGWKNVKLNKDVRSIFNDATKRYNVIGRLKSIELQNAYEQSIQLPAIFQCADADANTDTDTTIVDSGVRADGTTTDAPSSSVFYMCVPIAISSNPDDFHMVIHPKYSSVAKLNPNIQIGEETDDYKPSLTKITILHHGYYDKNSDDNTKLSNRKTGGAATTNGDVDPPVPVTLVELQPFTGRRHQLRIHSSLLNHSILGDSTYQNFTPTTVGSTSISNVSSDTQATAAATTISSVENNPTTVPRTTNTRTLCSRMCLHAQSLKVYKAADAAVPTENKKGRKRHKPNSKNNMAEDDDTSQRQQLLVNVTTKSPFQIMDDKIVNDGTNDGLVVAGDTTSAKEVQDESGNDSNIDASLPRISIRTW